MTRRGGYGTWYVTFASFAAVVTYLEHRALTKKDIVPATYALQEMLGLNPKKPWGRWTLLVLSGAWAWLIVHLAADITEAFSGDD